MAALALPKFRLIWGDFLLVWVGHSRIIIDPAAYMTLEIANPIPDPGVYFFIDDNIII